MNISDHLEAINTDNSSVQIVAFADLSVQLVLADSTKAEIGQEHLDTLCAQVADAFDSPLQTGTPSLIEPPTEVVVMRDDGVLISLRPTHDSSNALYLLCDYDVDINGAMAMARNALTETGAV